MENEVVWLKELRRFGFLRHRDAFYSTVLTWSDDGIWEEVLVENDDYDLWEERAIDYEQD